MGVFGFESWFHTLSIYSLYYIYLCTSLEIAGVGASGLIPTSMWQTRMLFLCLSLGQSWLLTGLSLDELCPFISMPLSKINKSVKNTKACDNLTRGKALLPLFKLCLCLCLYRESPCSSALRHFTCRVGSAACTQHRL